MKDLINLKNFGATFVVGGHCSDAPSGCVSESTWLNLRITKARKRFRGTQHYKHSRK